jgi:hypothetical protein
VKWIALAMFGGVGLIAFIAGCIWGYQRFMLYRDGVPAGNVVENTQTRSKDSDGHTSVSYYPVVEFTAQGGEKHRFTGSTGSSVADYEAGAKVSVRYDPRNPREPRSPTSRSSGSARSASGCSVSCFSPADRRVRPDQGQRRAFGPQFQRKMDAVRFVGKQGIRLDGRSTRCAAARQVRRGSMSSSAGRRCPGNHQQKFEAEPIFFNPGRGSWARASRSTSIRATRNATR